MIERAPSAGLAVAVAALLALAGPIRADDPIEPPVDAVEGEDVALEAADSLATGEVELGLGLEGAAGDSPRRRRRVRFEEPDFSGSVREGSGDPLAGGAVEGRGSGHAFVAGKLAPRWGRGLLLGAPAEPWRSSAVERDGRSRGRAGEGVLISRGRARGLDLVYGRFARRDLAGVRARAGRAAWGVLAGRGRELQSSLALARGDGQVEAVVDRGGAWRLEGQLERGLGAWRAAGAVRGGTAAFRSLAEPLLGGPARSLALVAAGATPAGDARVLASLWRYRPGLSGARVALECRSGDARSGRWSAGLEEQHGARRESATRSAGLRQGGWIEWSRTAAPLGLALRHEVWGAESGLRDVVRTVTSARIEAQGPRGSRAALTHAAFRTRRGESLYLAEAESDRLVLRAVAGEGHRSRLEVVVPAGHGRVRATVLVTSVIGKSVEPRWTVEWIRRSKRGRGE